MSMAHAYCRVCGREFRPDRFNPDQIYCTRAACVRDQKRVRQREWHRRRYETDPAFRAAAAARSLASRARRKDRGPPPIALVRAVSGLVPVAAGQTVLGHVLTGLACQLVGSRDPDAVGVFLDACEAQGRRLAGGRPEP